MAMRRWMAAAVVTGLVPCVGLAQTHVVKKPDAVVRAVGVYEWTGEEGKATASRLVPVTVFINGQLEDAGVYLARPVPFALQTGTIFEVEKGGVDTGSVELAYARHLVTGGPGSYDDGWLAVGAYKARPAEKVVAFKRESTAKLEVSGGSGPHFSQKDGDAGAAKAKPVDRSTAASGGVIAGDSSDKVGDSDSAKDDVERPTLKRRATPAESKAQAKKRGEASVTAVGDLNDDEDRPNLHRGKPVTRMEEEDLPPLKGIPAGMQQRVAVSDAKDRSEHDFKRAWESADEKAEVMAKMEAVAREKLSEYGGAVASVAPAPVKAGTAAARARRKATVPAAAAVVALADERLEGYTLSYGGAPTYFFSANSAGVGGVTRYVSVVAQREPLGSLKVAMASVTDDKHLDRTPWYRLVDAVDVDASNRASLLFELRGETTRQFALYRVIGAQADQTFLTSPAE